MSDHRQTDGKEDTQIELLSRALVVRRGPGGPVVLCCRSVKHGYLYLPGGHIEFGETAPEALRRELVEETGLASRVGACVLMDEQLFEQRGVRKHEYTLVFHVEHLEGEDPSVPAPNRPPITVESREPELGFEWVVLDELASRDLRPRAVRDWIVGADTDRLTWLGTESVETANAPEPPRSHGR